MSATTSIEWTSSINTDGTVTPGKTWNPVRGCSIVSAGCHNCYAMKQAHRFAWRRKECSTGHERVPGPYHGLTKQTKAGPQWTGKVVCVEDALLEPLSWRKPARVFVNSMSDLFHEQVPDEFIDRVFAVMALAPQHTFQILTKRAERMRAYLSPSVGRTAGSARAGEIQLAADRISGDRGTAHRSFDRVGWPMCNVWLGVSVEDQQRADERIPLLLQTPAAVRFLSCEPLLGPVDIGLTSATCTCCRRIFTSRWGRVRHPVMCDFPLYALPENRGRMAAPGIYRAQSNKHGALFLQTPGGDLGLRPDEFDALPPVDWVIVGGESGAGARPFDLAWARSIAEQCKAAGIPCFVKQLGAKAHLSEDGLILPIRYTDRKGGDMQEWPSDLRVREFPGVRA